MNKKFVVIALIISLFFINGCGKKESTNSNNGKNDNANSEQINNENQTQDDKKIEIVDVNSNSRPYAVVINNYPSAVKVQTGLSDAYLIYEMPVEGGMSRSLAFYKDKTTNKIGTVRSARHNFLDYVMENDAIFVHFGWSHYAEKQIPQLKINNINGLSDSPFWRENPEGLKSEHTAYTSLEKVISLAKHKGYRTTTDNKGVLTYSTSEIDLSKRDDSIIANNVEVPYSSNYYGVSFTYDADAKRYKRYVNGVAHIDYFTKEHYSTKNIIITKINYTKTDDNYYLDLKNTGTGEGYYITNGYAVPIIWEKPNRSSKTIYKYKDGTPINVNDGNTYIMLQSINQKTTIN